MNFTFNAIKALLLCFFLFSLTFFGSISHAEEPKVGDERVFLHTTYGDLVLGFYPEVAPKHVEQILKLFRLGIYNGLDFYRVERGFVAQISNEYSRTEPLSVAQKSAIHPIPAEFSKLKHRRGVLSMARFEDPNSAEVSFSFLLKEAPHLDEKYTVFGKILDGFDTLEAIEKVPVDVINRPTERILIKSAEVVTEKFMQGVFLKHPASKLLKERGIIPNAIAYKRNGLAILFLAVVAAFAFAISLLSAKFNREKKALALLIMLISAIGIFSLAEPLPPGNAWIAGFLFFGVLGMFKLLGRFEAPED